jgi:hypothetical protein
MPWNFETQTGNPTKSREVNDVIRAVRKKEVRHQGRASNARRHFELSELTDILEICHNAGEDDPKRYWLACYLKFQFHMIARNDDISHVYAESIMPNLQHPFTLKTRLRWAKNVNEERDAPEQIVMGANNWRFCVLLALAIYMEIWIGSGVGVLNTFLFTTAGDNPQASAKTAGDHLKRVLRDPHFQQRLPGKLGMHSGRKCGKTFARRQGESKDNTDFRGRWKGKARPSDVYEDTILEYPDAKVAATLCIGGPIKYSLRENSGVDNAWLGEHVVPNIATRYPEEVWSVLGTALLWACFDQEASPYVPAWIRDHVVQSYQQLGEHVPEGENPVEKLHLVISGNDDMVDIQALAPAADGAAAAAPGVANAAGTHATMLALQNEIRNLRFETAELFQQLNNRMGRMETNQQHQHERVHENLQRLNQLRFPVVRHRQAQAQPEGANNGNAHNAANAQVPLEQGRPATLFPRPSTLNILWQEYQFGVGGRLPARLFTREQSGRVKHAYCRRKIIWDLIQNQISKGYTADAAIDRIYSAYPGLQITDMTKAIRDDRERYSGPNQGLHPLLRR